MEMESSSSDSSSDSSDSSDSSSDSDSDSERLSRRQSYSPERRRRSPTPRADSRRRLNSSPARRQSPLGRDRDYDRRRDHVPPGSRHGEKGKRPSLSPPPVRSRYSGRAGRSFSRSKSPGRSRSPPRKHYGRDDQHRYSSRRDNPHRREDSLLRRDRYEDKDNERDVSPPLKRRRQSVGRRGSNTPPLRARNARTPPRYRDRSRSRDHR
jgi:pre-mRNA-splicing factor CWC22